MKVLDFINNEVDPPVPVYTTREIGMPWIIGATVTRNFREVLVISISDFDQSRLDDINRLLNNNGFTKFTTSINT